MKFSDEGRIFRGLEIAANLGGVDHVVDFRSPGQPVREISAAVSRLRSDAFGERPE
jgi:hypothetical protein